MVKKLFKHEALAYLRVWIPMIAILFTVAIFGKLLYLFHIDSVMLNIFKNSATVIYVLGAVAVISLTYVFSVVRFYKNLYSCEGYLSFTLPVTPANHITVKLITACVFQIGSILCVILSSLFFASAETKKEFFTGLREMTDILYATLGGHLVLYITELFIMALVMMIIGYLIPAMCITIGQTFKKNRIIGAVIVYFIYYIIKQVIGTLILIGCAFLDTQAILLYIASHRVSVIHAGLLTGIVIESIFAVLYFFIIHSVMKKKLNLE